MKNSILWSQRLPRLLILVLLGTATLTAASCQVTLLDPGSVRVADSANAADAGDSALDSLTDVQRQLATRAIETVATELDLALDVVGFVAITEVDWPDASLGCPQEGMMYAQMITSGHMILVEANGAEHEVHTGADGESQVIFCQEK